MHRIRPSYPFLVFSWGFFPPFLNKSDVDPLPVRVYTQRLVLRTLYTQEVDVYLKAHVEVILTVSHSSLEMHDAVDAEVSVLFPFLDP